MHEISKRTACFFKIQAWFFFFHVVKFNHKTLEMSIFYIMSYILLHNVNILSSNANILSVAVIFYCATQFYCTIQWLQLNGSMLQSFAVVFSDIIFVFLWIYIYIYSCCCYIISPSGNKDTSDLSF